MRGHEERIGRIAWSPDGRIIASPSLDGTIRLWDVETGLSLEKLDARSGPVNCVAWSPDGRVLAAGPDEGGIQLWDSQSDWQMRVLGSTSPRVKAIAWSPDGRVLAHGDSSPATILLLDVQSGSVITKLEGHTDQITSLKWLPNGQMLVSGSSDRTAKLWDVSTGENTRTFEGHTDWIVTVSLLTHGSGTLLVTAGDDKTIRVWDLQSGRLTKAIEGHTGRVCCSDISFDQVIFASKGGDYQGEDETIRLWNCATWEPVAVITEPASDIWPPGLAFHPSKPLLATVGSDVGASVEERDTLIHIWELGSDVLLRKASETDVQARAIFHTTAKIVLVGDSGVGKTGLGWRLAHGEFKEHASTHGQQFWVVNELGARREDGTECEAILWDLAGQPDYRLTHALFLDDADVALVLFDPTHSSDPLHGVEFWLKQLSTAQDKARAAQEERCGTILVGARADRGEARLTRDELDEFCRQRSIRGGYLPTSAYANTGLEELLSRIKELIAWEQKPATVTTVTFKRIKDYVLALKEQPERKEIIVSPAELRARLQATDQGWEFSDGEMITAVGHLANYGYVRALRTSKGEDRVLLAPELLNNLAASFVLEARRNQRGLGSLEEKRLLDGGYPFPELDGLPLREREVLLDAAALLFLEHNICFRETDPLTSQSYLVFPELINLKKPLLEDEQLTEDGAAFTVSGAVENVYASLVVLLGYTQMFTRTDQWRGHAQYEVGDRLICGFRQEAEREGEVDFVLYYGTDASAPIRRLFQSLFESFLARRNLDVLRFEPVVCPNGHPLERAVVRTQLRKGNTYTFCSDCGERTKLPKRDEPIQLRQEEQRKVEEQRWFADQRTRFEQAVYRLSSYVENQRMHQPECFISYAWGDEEYEGWVERSLATDLQKAAVGVVLDRWENARIGLSVARFVERIERSDLVIVVGTPLYRKKYDNKDPDTGYVVAAEVDMISNRLLGTEEQKESVLPLLLAGRKEMSLPPLLHGRVYADLRDQHRYFTAVFDLILSIYNIPFNHQAVADLRESLRESHLP